LAPRIPMLVFSPGTMQEVSHLALPLPSPVVSSHALASPGIPMQTIHAIPPPVMNAIIPPPVMNAIIPSPMINSGIKAKVLTLQGRSSGGGSLADLAERVAALEESGVEQKFERDNFFKLMNNLKDQMDRIFRQVSQLVETEAKRSTEQAVQKALEVDVAVAPLRSRSCSEERIGTRRGATLADGPFSEVHKLRSQEGIVTRFESAERKVHGIGAQLDALVACQTAADEVRRERGQQTSARGRASAGGESEWQPKGAHVNSVFRQASAPAEQSYGLAPVPERKSIIGSPASEAGSTKMAPRSSRIDTGINSARTSGPVVHTRMVQKPAAASPLASSRVSSSPRLLGACRSGRLSTSAVASTRGGGESARSVHPTAMQS